MSDDDLSKVWARSLADLADMNIEPHQRAWLQLTRPLGLVENTALIAAPNEFVKEQLETRLRALITNALSRELARTIQLAVTVDPAALAELPEARAAANGTLLHGNEASGADDITGPLPPLGGLSGDSGYPDHPGAGLRAEPAVTANSPAAGRVAVAPPLGWHACDTTAATAPAAAPRASKPAS